MIRCMVVEDEPPILRGICNMISNADERFLVTESAFDGEEAIHLVERNIVDVVFTDMNMPVCNGIGLMQYIQENWPEILVVGISGYREFEYIRGAMKSGAIDYLLKPVSMKELKELLDKIWKILWDRQDQYIQRWLYQIEGKETNGQNRVLLERKFFWALCCEGTWAYNQDSDCLPGSTVWKTIEYKNTMSVLHPDEKMFSFCGKTSVERLFCFEAEDTLRWAIIREALFSDLQTGELPVTFLYMEEPIPIEQSASLFVKMHQRLHECTIFGRSLSIKYGENPETVEHLRTDQVKKRWFITAVKDRSKKNIDAAIDAIINEIQGKRILRTEIEQMIFDLLSESNIPHTDYNAFFHEIIDCSYSADLLRNELKEIIFTQISGESLGNFDKEQLVQNMKDYICSHYHESITMQMLSRRFGLVAPYLSKIFKTQIGVSPVEYLQKIRIEEAKKLLRTADKIGIAEVASLVGYPDALYFSRVFKKIEGVQPSKYRENVREA